MMSHYLKRLVFIFTLIVFNSAFSASELRGIVQSVVDLYNGPTIDSGKTGFRVEIGEEVYVMGTSIGGSWARIAKKDEGTGWIPTRELKVHRVSPDEIHEVQKRLEKEARFQTLLNLEANLSSGSVPFGKGGVFSFSFNLTPKGITGLNADQVEIGGLIGYYLGADVFGFVDHDDERYQLNSDSRRKFLSYGLFGQWLFRSGERGSFMVGPRLGILVTKFNYFSAYHAPITGGVSFRYFPEENWGVNASAQVSFDTSVYFVYMLGATFRL